MILGQRLKKKIKKDKEKRKVEIGRPGGEKESLGIMLSRRIFGEKI